MIRNPCINLGYPILESVAQPAIKSRGGACLCVYVKAKWKFKVLSREGGKGMTRGNFRHVLCLTHKIRCKPNFIYLLCSSKTCMHYLLNNMYQKTISKNNIISVFKKIYYVSVWIYINVPAFHVF